MTVLFNCAQRMETISGISEKPEYAGHTVNFRTHVKSYKNKKRVDNPKEGGCCHNCCEHCGELSCDLYGLGGVVCFCVFHCCFSFRFRGFPLL